MTNTPEQVRAELRARMADHINAALACLDTVGDDPEQMERAARMLADDLLPEAASRVKAVRGEAVHKMRGEGPKKRPMREIAEQLGLSLPRVDQLLKGK
ncbi:hypothetical protein [Streptomyces sp. NPDC002644]